MPLRSLLVNTSFRNRFILTTAYFFVIICSFFALGVPLQAQEAVQSQTSVIEVEATSVNAADPLTPKQPYQQVTITFEKQGIEVTGEVLPYALYVARIAGLLAFLALGFSLITGVLTQFSIMSVAQATKIHVVTGILGFGLAIIHPFSLLYDVITWGPLLSVKNVLFPFTYTGEDSFALVLGGVAFYLFILTIVTSAVYRKLPRRIWRILHSLNYPLFFLIAWHGYQVGTDSNGVIFIAGSVFTIMVTLATAVRFVHWFGNIMKQYFAYEKID